MPLILKEEEGTLLKGKQVQVPKYVLDDATRIYNMYSNNKEARMTKGFKRLQKLIHSKNISFGDLKGKVFDFEHMNQNPNNLQFTLNGGKTMRDWSSYALKSLRNSVKKVDMVPEVPKLEKDKSLKVEPITKSSNINGVDVDIHESFNKMIRKIYK